MPHLGLMSLAFAARAGGHEALIFDPKHHILDQRLARGDGLFEQLARQILTLNPEVVGFTGLGCLALRIRRYVRSRRQLPEASEKISRSENSD